MKAPSKEFFDELYDEIVVRDFYGIRHFKQDDFDVVLDLGANIGVFSWFARYQFPKAKIIAVEAEPTLWPYLQSNLENLDVSIIKAPIGNGGHVTGFDRSDINPGCNIFGEVNEGTTSTIKTVTIPLLLLGHELARTLIKIDIEGSERQVLLDPKTVKTIKYIKHLVGETHFGPTFVNAGVGWNSFTSMDNDIQKAYGSSGLLIENINRHSKKDTKKEDASGLLVMSQDSKKGIWVSRCQHCKHDHLVHPESLDDNKHYTSWAFCPKTGKPIFFEKKVVSPKKI